MSDSENDDGFYYGEWVESKLNTNVFGIVVGSDAMGLKYDVQLSPSLVVAQFYGVTLRAIEDEDGAEGEYNPDPPTGVVINFTEAKALRANTKTRGVA